MNENCYLISFETANSAVQTNLINTIKSYRNWAKITSTTWAVITTDPAATVRDRLMAFLSPTDRIFVIKSGYEAAWRSTYCSSEWLKANL